MHSMIPSAPRKPVGPRQHIVPQMMIRRFAGSDGRLWEMRKPNLAIGSRSRSPKGILFRDNYYKDRVSDLDADLLTPIELAFSKCYPTLADQLWSTDTHDEDTGAAFVDWVSSMMVRTPMMVETIGDDFARFGDPLMKLLFGLAPDIMLNYHRERSFRWWRDLLCRPNWRWKCRVFPSGSNVVLTDHPVCQTNGLQAGGVALLVPLSKSRVLVGGLPEAVDRFRDISARELEHTPGWLGPTVNLRHGSSNVGDPCC